MSGVPVQSAALPDAVAGQWFLSRAPARWLPFIQLARLDRPIGWWLLLLPTWWSSALAGIVAGHGPNVLHIVLFLLGAMSMRGAGSTYNDLVDREIDAKVERTRQRPLPSGRVSPAAARVFMVAQALVGFAVVLSFNWFTILLGCASLAIVAAYPFTKRFTFWPQAVLGLAFAWGGLVGWAAAFGSLAPPAFLIYLGAIFWTIGYDTIYAVQDVADDPAAGVKSTARFFDKQVRLGVGALYAASVISVEAALLAAGATDFFAQLGVAGFAAHLAWQVTKIVPDDRDRALRLFRANRDAGLILFAGLTMAAFQRAVF